MSNEEKQSILLTIEKDHQVSIGKYRAVLVAVYLFLIYLISIGIWGFVVGKAIQWFFLGGGIFGLLVGLISAVAISKTRNVEGTKDTQFASGAIFGNIGMFIGAIGLVSLIIKSIFLS